MDQTKSTSFGYSSVQIIQASIKSNKAGYHYIYMKPRYKPGLAELRYGLNKFPRHFSHSWYIISYNHRNREFSEQIFCVRGGAGLAWIWTKQSWLGSNSLHPLPLPYLTSSPSPCFQTFLGRAVHATTKFLKNQIKWRSTKFLIPIVVPEVKSIWYLQQTQLWKLIDLGNLGLVLQSRGTRTIV